jgi:O-antigen ligase
LIRPVYRFAISTLLTVGLFLSFSRLAWIALAVGLLVSIVFPLKQKVDDRIKSVSPLAFIIVVFAVLSALFAPLVFSRVTGSGRLEAKSVTTRLGAIRDAQAIFGLHPLTGVGAGAFSSAIISEVAPTRSGFEAEPVHDVPLLVLAELGIFGLGVFVMLMYWCFNEALANRELGMGLALIVLALGDHWAWSTLGGILIFWAGWGIAMRKA